MIHALLVVQAAAASAPAEFQSPRVRESSGVVVSRAYPGILWTHNDSGDRPYLYATDLQGRDLGYLRVPGAQAVDWEDASRGPCPKRARTGSGTCIYIADTGDNFEGRPAVTVYAVPEPVPPVGPGDTLQTTAAPAVLHVRYPDGAHDVEAMYVSPRDSALYLVTKGGGGGRTRVFRVYRVAREAWEGPGPATATVVQTLDIHPNPEAGRVVTGAAIRPDARLVALRTYSEIYLFVPGAGGRLTPARQQGRPCDIAGLEIGGEAIDFLTDSSLVVTSEATRQRKGTIHTVVCSRT